MLYYLHFIYCLYSLFTLLYPGLHFAYTHSLLFCTPAYILRILTLYYSVLRPTYCLYSLFTILYSGLHIAYTHSLLFCTPAYILLILTLYYSVLRPTYCLYSPFTILYSGLQYLPRFMRTLQMSLDQICGYSAMVGEVERLRKQSYCADDIYHENTLLKVH